jgi:hypothetical protein
VTTSTHTLLNSSAIVCMGLTFMLEQWETLPPEERGEFLAHLVRHAEAVDEGLKRLVLNDDQNTV